jgi:hypothetical protein
MATNHSFGGGFLAPHGTPPPMKPWVSRADDSAGGARFLGTWPHGAVTVRSHPTGLVVETFRTGQRFAVRAERTHEA